jgi:hypothetical protein
VLLLDQVLEFGLDHDVDNQGLKNLKQAQLTQFLFNSKLGSLIEIKKQTLP